MASEAPVAVTITDLRTTINECDATTGWSNTVSGQGAYTSDPDPWEPSACMGFQVSNESGYAYRTVSYNLTGQLIYAPIQANGTMNTFANVGIGIVLGDGTNTIAYAVGGSNVGGFVHSVGPVRWTAFVLDTASLPATFVTIAGSEASLDLSAITLFGIYFYTLSKSLGGTENCFVDILRWGNGGLRITGGGTGTEGNFDDIAAADRSTSTEDGAYCMCRELASGAYGLQGPITIGDSAGTSAVDWESDGETVIFEEPYNGVATTRYFIKAEGNSTGTSDIVFTKGTFICPVGVGASLDFTDPDVDTFTIDECTWRGFEQGISFLTTTTSNTWSVTDSIFDGCGEINLGFLLQDGTFTGNTISNSTNSANGALTLSSTGYTSGLDLTNTTFVSGGTGHAIYITQAGTYDFTNLTFSGYGAGETTNAAIYNNSGGAVTINATNCSGLTVRNGASATTTVNASVTLTVTAKDLDNVVVESARVLLEAASGGAAPSDASVTITRVTTTATVAHTAHGMKVGELVAIRGANQQEYNGVNTITAVTANSYDYTVSGTPATPATGTITATQVYINELTNASGIATENMNFGTTQPIRGTSRKSSSGDDPKYIAGRIVGDITSTGFTTTVIMVEDE
jgi:hypothetical protein